MPRFKVGDRIRWADSVIRKARASWNNWEREPFKSGAKRHLDALIAARGAVTRVYANQYLSEVIDSTWDDGSTHSSVPWLFEIAED